METIGNLLEKFKVQVELDEKVKNHKLTECNIDNITITILKNMKTGQSMYSRET